MYNNYYYRLDTEDRKKLFEKQIEVYQTMCKKLNECDIVIKKFDGKVYNKKVSDAIMDLSDHPVISCSCHKDSYSNKIYLSVRQYGNTSIKVLHEDSEIIDSYTVPSTSFEYIEIIVDKHEGKQPRVNYQKTHENIMQKFRNATESINHYYNVIDNLQEYNERIAKITQELRDANTLLFGEGDMDFRYIFFQPYEIKEINV